MIQKTVVASDYDALTLSVAYCEPEAEPKGVLQIVHGMAEHKERYFAFMEYLAERGYASIIHDHRGHGESVKSEEDLGFMYEGGWIGMVEDVRKVQDLVKEKWPSVPVALMGHSMGSMVVRSFAKRYDDSIAKLIVCGCPSDNPAKGVGYMLASLIGKVKGERHRSKLLDNMSFGAYNKPFESEGEFAWLSANNENVKAYVADPLCGYCFTANGFRNLLGVMKDCYSPEGWKMANAEMPVMFISGGDDPCRTSDKAFQKAVDFMRERGYKNVNSKLYPGLRHEILLEKEAEMVYADVAEFLK